MNKLARVALLLLTLASPAFSADKEPDIHLTAYPRIALTDGVRIEAFVPRHSANRRIRVEMEGPLSRAFEEDMDGDKARVIYAITVNNKLADGVYTVTLAVQRVDGSVKRKQVEFCRGEGCIADVG